MTNAEKYLYPKPIDHMQLSCSVCMSGYYNPKASKEMTLTRAEIILQTVRTYGTNYGGN